MVVRKYSGFDDVVDLLLFAALVISSLSPFVSSFKGAIVSLNVPRILAIIAGAIFPGLGPASLIVRRSGRTFSPVVRSVGRTLYYIGFLCRVFGERLSPSCFCQDCARDFGVLNGNRRSIAHGGNESFP